MTAFEGLWLIPALPLAGALVLAAGRRLPRRAVAAIGVGSVGTSAVIAALVAWQFIASPPAGHAVSQVLWSWLTVAGFAPQIALYLDALSLVMVLVVTVVGLLIHFYSAAFMARQGTPPGDGYRRFFACMNLFVASMLILVLADNLLLLYLGWEGVGLCSYLLIGFWYKDPANGQAAMKAFIVTRVGDAALAVGLFVLFANLHTLHIQNLLREAAEQWTPGSAIAVAAAALLLGGAVGKSAQLPLQTWLPDAMAGPTPVSALIHAATMVTAGVYLIARTHVLFELAPPVQSLVAVIGALTLLTAGCSALVQRDIKRVLAYSTISQVGYMFLALGVGAWSAAIFHLVTHAFFKSLLFLAAGVVIARLREEHDLLKMGGLRRAMPVVFWTFLVGALGLASMPPATAGFSKEAILSAVWNSGAGAPWLFAAGLAGVFITSLYTFRMVFLAFFGEAHGTPDGETDPVMALPLVVLALACLCGGLLHWPEALGGHGWLGGFLSSTFGTEVQAGPVGTERILGAVSEAATFLGLAAAGLLYARRRACLPGLVRSPVGVLLHRLWSSGWGFDEIYAACLVRPFVSLARFNRNDGVDLVYQALARANRWFHLLLSLTQTGRVRGVATGMTVGAILILLILVFQ